MSEKFKELLRQHHKWPCKFTFKFIVKVIEQDKVLKHLNNFTLRKKLSANGTYVSISATAHMELPEDVIDMYERMSKIKGVICL